MSNVADGPHAKTDKCPGTVKLSDAHDGKIARFRFPGGRILPHHWQQLAHLATEYGDGVLRITSRANVQVRGISRVQEFRTEVAGTDLVPSDTHEHMRNILGPQRDGDLVGLPVVKDIVQALDTAVMASELASSLSGRFLFAVDDCSGQACTPSSDIEIQASFDGADRVLTIRCGHTPVVSLRSVDECVSAVICGAEEFVRLTAQRPSVWRLGDATDEDRQRVSAAIRKATESAYAPQWATPQPPTDTVGWSDALDGSVTLVGGLPLGEIPARMAEFFAAVNAETIISPRGTVAFKNLSEHVAEQCARVFAPMGMIFDAASPLLAVSCCTTDEGCPKALSAVRSDALQWAENSTPDGLQHFAGCDRKCGMPQADRTHAVTCCVATGSGYETVSFPAGVHY